MDTCFKNLAEDYCLIAMGSTPKINVNWSTGTDEIERCSEWVKRMFPENLKDKDLLIRISDELSEYTDKYQEAGFIQGFMVAMDLMKERGTQKGDPDDKR